MKLGNTSQNPCVCLIVPHFAEYGFSLANALVAKGAQVLVVANEENTLAEMGEAFIRTGCGGVRTHFFRKSKNPLNVLLQAWELRRVIRALRPDVLHVQEDSKDVVAAALPFLPRVPMLLTMHDPKPHTGDDARVRKRTRHGAYIEQVRRRANAVVVHGGRLVRDARVAIKRPGVEVHVIPHGPLGEPVAAAMRAATQEPLRCLFFGRIEAYKGLHHFIAVVRALRVQGVPAVGVVAGRGTDLERHRADLQDRTMFELIDKFLTPEEVVQEFQKCSVVVMPYDDATQSGVAAYAIGMGRPVVAFDVGALREMVQDGETGLVIRHGDLPALTEATRQVLVNADLAGHLQAGARRLATGEFSWARIAEKTLAVYAKLLAAHPNAARPSRAR